MSRVTLFPSLDTFLSYFYLIFLFLLLLLLLLLLFYYYYYYFINLAFCTGRFYTNILPIKGVITSDRRLMGLLSISYVFKNQYFPILLHSFSPVPFPYLPPFFLYQIPPNPISINLIHNLKPSLI